MTRDCSHPRVVYNSYEHIKIVPVEHRRNETRIRGYTKCEYVASRYFVNTLLNRDIPISIITLGRSKNTNANANFLMVRSSKGYQNITGSSHQNPEDEEWLTDLNLSRNYFVPRVCLGSQTHELQF